MHRFSKSREEAEINVTPMLGIVFIMLIFFIVTATFARERGLLARTPPEAPPRQDDPPENCLGEFTVTETGMTADCIVVSEESAFSGFGTAACRAIAKWRYRPRIVSGEALPVVGVQTLLTFRLAEE